MTWYGENRSGRQARWNEGDLIRYDYGPTALMRITGVREMGADPRGISCSVRYYGRAFHSSGTYTGRYHGQCLEPSEEDRALWARCHDDNDEWIPGSWGSGRLMARPWFKLRDSEIAYYLGNLPQAADWEPVSDSRCVAPVSVEDAHEIARDWLLRHGRTEEELAATVGDRWGPALPAPEPPRRSLWQGLFGAGAST
jgi:hypothetical protein